MCTGAEIALLASAGATVGGTMMQGQAENRRRQAQSSAAQAEMQRQSALENRRASSFQEALELMRREGQQENIDEAVGERAQLMEQATALPQQAGDYESPASSNAPRVVRDHAASRQGRANDFASQLGLARAQLGGWGEGMLPFRQGLEDATFDMDELARQMGASAQIGGMEAQNAYQNTGNRTAMLGNLMAQGGQMGMMAAGNAGGMGSLGSLFGGGGGAGASPGLYNNEATGATHYGGVPRNLYG